jgi:hypothetical protein
MPELVQESSSPPIAAPPPIPPGAPVIPPEQPPADTPPGELPIFDPDSWEDFPVFRETFLMYVTPPGYSSALRSAGEMLYSLLLETPSEWPGWTESTTRTELRAAAADLRHLEGFLASIGTEHQVASLSIEDAWLSKMAAKLAPRLGGIAAKIEMKLSEVRS